MNRSFRRCQPTTELALSVVEQSLFVVAVKAAKMQECPLRIKPSQRRLALACLGRHICMMCVGKHT